MFKRAFCEEYSFLNSQSFSGNILVATISEFELRNFSSIFEIIGNRLIG